MNLFIHHYRNFIRKKLAIFRPLDRVERRFAPFSNVEFQYASIGEPSDRFRRLFVDKHHVIASLRNFDERFADKDLSSLKFYLVGGLTIIAPSVEKD